jgi:GNAT superfamily N-acetyltransferase
LAYGSFFSHYLAPEHRRFGIASRLLASAEEWMVALGSKYAKAQTHVKNIKAQNLFRKCGYHVTGSLIGRWPYYELKKNW